MPDFKTLIGYILAIGTLLWTVLKDLSYRKQRDATRRETETNTRKVEVDIADTLLKSYKDDAIAWRDKFNEEKALNLELVVSNKLYIENLAKEQAAKADYLEEVRKLRIEVQELKNIIIKFQAQFPDLFKEKDLKFSSPKENAIDVIVTKNLDK